MEIMSVVKSGMGAHVFSSVHSALILGVLVCCSLVCLMFILERWRFFSRIKVDPEKVLLRLHASLAAGKTEEALGILGEVNGNPLLAMIQTGIKSAGFPKESFEEMMRLCLMRQRAAMERNLGLLGTLGNVSPFIGLLGTVMGIIQAFQDLAGAAGQANGANVVAVGIAEALVATAAGLIVAIPAVVAYNYFLKKVKSLVMEMEAIGMEMAIILSTKKGGAVHASR